jgi:type IV pilus assembly protein PilM
MFKNLRSSGKNKSSNETKADVNSGKTRLALDIGSKTTKLVVGKFKGAKASVDVMNGTVNNKGAVLNGKILNISDAQKTVQKLIKASGTRVRNVVFTVETTSLIRREIDIPNLPDEFVSGAVSYQMSEYFPIDVQSYSLQLKPIGIFTEDGYKKRRFSVAALSKEITETYVNFCELMGIDNTSLDINSNAIEKLLQLEIKTNPNCPFKNRNVVFIDMGHSFFNVGVYANGTYLFNKMIPIGGYMVDDIIAKRMKITPEDAEQIKVSNGSRYSAMDLMHQFSKSSGRDDMEGMVLRDTLSAYERWVMEIEQVLKYFTTRNKSNNIDEIYIYGGCSFINGIDQYLNRRLRLPTQAHAEFRCIDAGSHELNKNILNYLNPIGALIRG